VNSAAFSWRNLTEGALRGSASRHQQHVVRRGRPAAEGKQTFRSIQCSVLVVKCTCEEMENSLLCTESLSVSRGEHDPVIFADRRVLDNLLADEARSMLVEDYFTTNQTDLTPNMRSVVVTWMMEVCTLHLSSALIVTSCSS
jgi:hypothetical protein